MREVIDKELISHLLLLESKQQKLVLDYIKAILTSNEMDQRADASEAAIAAGKVKTFDQFNADFENWKAQKRAATK